jgi:hypothetical protein
MLENRSFDHMLGWPDIEGTRVPIDPRDPTAGFAPVFRLTPASYRTEPDPGHEFEDVTVQLFGRQDPPQGASPTNDGFILNYSQRLGANDQPVGPAIGKKILGLLPPGAVAGSQNSGRRVRSLRPLVRVRAGADMAEPGICPCGHVKGPDHEPECP